MSQPIVIAIDGPSASGKSTNAKTGRQGIGLRLRGYRRHVSNAGLVLLARSGWMCTMQKPSRHCCANGKRGSNVWTKKFTCSWMATIPKRKSAPRKPVPPCRTSRPFQSARMDEENAARLHSIRRSRHGRARHRHARLPGNGPQVLAGCFVSTNGPGAAPRKAFRKTWRPGTSATASARRRRSCRRLGALKINNSGLTPEQSSAMIIEEVKRRLAEREKR